MVPVAGVAFVAMAVAVAVAVAVVVVVVVVVFPAGFLVRCRRSLALLHSSHEPASD